MKMAEQEETTGISEKIMREPCRQYVDVLMYCYSPANQVSTYYRTGLVDDCVKPFNQLKLCLRLKMNRPEEERVKLYEELKRRNEHSPTADVWPMRQDPRKDWTAPQTLSSDSSSKLHI